MIRLIQLIIGFYPLLFITTIMSEDVKLTQQAPSKVGDLEPIVVEIKVEKGDIEGFAKYQVSIPEGFTAEQIDTKGATFTFDANTVKLIWLELPKQNEFVFTYMLTPTDAAPQFLELTGRFSYLEDNNRMIAEANKVTIQIGETQEEIIAQQEADIPVTASVSRNISITDQGLMQVDITVTKTKVEGFSKIEELLPASYEVEPINENSGVFTYLRGKAKFVWMNTPAGDQYSVSYLIKPALTAADMAQLGGTYSFLDDNETKKIDIAVGTYPDNAQTIAMETTELDQSSENESNVQEEEESVQTVDNSSESESESVEEEIPLEVEQVVQETLAKKIEENEPQVQENEIDLSNEGSSTSVEQNTTASNENIPAPETGISYKVQILAGKKVVDAQYFKARHSYEENFNIENHEGWVKYTTGKFAQYKSARDKRENLRGGYNLPGPFVTAYNNGTRITVQEALMVSNQKWYK